MTATAQAVAAMTATAEARFALTATANAAFTATANAALRATANAQATQQVLAGLTATAAAIPTITPTPTPQPTMTPAPFAVSGTINDVSENQITLKPVTAEDSPPTYPVRADAVITRDGKSAVLNQVEHGDSVRLTVEGSSRVVVGIDASAAPGRGLMTYWWISMLPFLIGAIAVRRSRNLDTEPFIIRRIVA